MTGPRLAVRGRVEREAAILAAANVSELAKLIRVTKRIATKRAGFLRPQGSSLKLLDVDMGNARGPIA
jgi:hypothetical protein